METVVVLSAAPSRREDAAFAAVEATAAGFGAAVEWSGPGTALAKHLYLTGHRAVDEGRLLAQLRAVDGVAGAYTAPGADPALPR